MVQTLVTIDDSLRLEFARLEGALGVRFSTREIDRIFTDAVENQRYEKHYTFFDSDRIRVTGYVEDYEPETIWIIVKAPRKLIAFVTLILTAAGDRHM